MSEDAVMSSPLYQKLPQQKELLQVQFNNLIKLINGSKQERFIPAENPLQQTLFYTPPTEAVVDVEKVTLERSKPQKKKDIVIALGKRRPAHLR